jgi:hypothetical protein
MEEGTKKEICDMTVDELAAYLDETIKIVESSAKDSNEYSVAYSLGYAIMTELDTRIGS